MLLRSVGLRRGGAFVPPPSPSLTDDFEAHQLGVGVPAGWTEGGGNINVTWTVTDTNPIADLQSLRASHSGTGERALTRDGSARADGTVTALGRVATGGSNGQIAVIGRYIDGDNHLQARVSAESGSTGLALVERAAGVSTLKLRPAAVAMNTVYRAELVMIGSTVYAAGYDSVGNIIQLIKANTTVLAPGLAGISQVGNTTVTYDNFAVTAATTPPALLSRSLDFDGVDDIATITNKAAFDITTNLTLEADCKPDAVNGNRTLINRFQGGAAGYILRIENGKAAFYVRISNIFQGVLGETTIPTGAWVHLAGVYDGANLNVFVNGVLDGTTAQAGSIGTGSAPLRFGASSAGERFDGKITNARVWSVDRTGNLGAAVGGDEAGLVVSLGVANLGNGALWWDGSPNMYDATITGATWSADVPT